MSAETIARSERERVQDRVTVPEKREREKEKES